MNKLTVPILMMIILACASCRSWNMINDRSRNSNYYSGFCRNFDMTEWKFKDNKNKWYNLYLYNDGIFRFSESNGSRPFKSGDGIWYDCGDYIILDFNRYDENQKRRELQESLTGCTAIKMMCVVLKKKGRKDLRILPSKAVLSRIY